MNAPITPLLPTRTLGYGEELWLRLSAVASNNGVLVATLEGAVDPRRMERALGHAVTVYPMLRARVEAGGKRPRFQFPRTAPLRWQVIRRESQSQWRALAERELADGIRPDEPVLWRATLVHGMHCSELLMTFNHAIMDALSVQNLLDTLLQAYAEDVPVMPPMAPPPCYEPMLAHQGPLALMMTAVRQWWSRRSSLESRRVPVNPLYQPGEPLTTAFRTLALDEATTQQLLALAKAREVSLHGLIGSLYLLSAYEAMKVSSRGTNLRLGSAVNARHLLSRDLDQDFGYFVSALESSLDLTPKTDLWQLADRIAGDVKRQFHGNSLALGVWIKRLLLAWRPDPKALVATATRSSTTQLHLTNFGRLRVRPRYGDLTLKRFMALPSTHFLAKPLVCLESHHFSGQLDFTFSYPAPVTDPTFVGHLVSGFERRIRELTAPPESPGRRSLRHSANRRPHVSV